MIANRLRQFARHRDAITIPDVLVANFAGKTATLIRLLGRHPDNRIIVLFDRLAVLLVGLTGMFVALGEVRVIFDFVLYAWAGLGAAFGPALILVLLWRRTSATGVLAGMAVGFVTAIVWRETLHDTLYELVPAFVVAFVTVWAVSLLYPDKN